MNPNTSSTERLIAKVLRDVRRRQAFTTYADLKVALRTELGRLRIRYRQYELDDAISLVATNAALVVTPRVPPRPPAAIDTPALSRVEAKRIYEQIMARLRSECAS